MCISLYYYQENGERIKRLSSAVRIGGGAQFFILGYIILFDER